MMTNVGPRGVYSKRSRQFTYRAWEKEKQISLILGGGGFLKKNDWVLGGKFMKADL